MAGINGTSATGHCFVENGKYYYQDATGSKFQIHKGDYTAFQTHGYTPKRLVSNNITNCIVENGKYYFVDGNGNKYPAFKGDYTKFKTHGYLPQNVKINPNNVTSQLEQAQKQLNNLQQSITQSKVTGELHPALNGKGVTPANFSTTYGNLNHLYAQGPVGNVAGEFTTTYGSAEQLRNAAPTGNIAPEATGQKPAQRITYSKTKEGVNKGKWGVFADGKLQSVHNTKTQANNAFNELRGTPKAPKAPVIKGSSAVFPTADGNAYAKMLEENPIKGNTPTQPKGLTPEAKIALDNARRAEAGAKFQGTSQAAMDKLHSTGYNKELSKYYAELEANNKPVKLPEGTSGIRKNPPIGDPSKLKYLPDGKLPEVKPNTQGGGFWGKLWKSVKNNKGKIGLAVGALALVGTAIGVSQCSDDKKATSVDNKDNKDNKNDSTTVKKNDVPKPAPQGANGELKAGQPVFVDGQFHVVKKGECPWSIAADILQKQGKTDNASILKLTQKIMSNNQLKFENDEGLVIIHPNDTLDVRG